MTDPGNINPGYKPLVPGYSEPESQHPRLPTEDPYAKLAQYVIDIDLAIEEGHLEPEEGDDHHQFALELFKRIHSRQRAFYRDDYGLQND